MEGGLLSLLEVKWYWFHLAMQVGFLTREWMVISSLDGWFLEVTLAQLAVWLTLALVALEVWNFSKVRCGSEQRKIAVDGLLDMLLLPVNIAFFCSLSVRILCLQPGPDSVDLVMAIIESPDIYEAFALWSVLELFVKVVEGQAGRMQQRGSNVDRSFASFKSISLKGVKAWVFIQSLVVAFKLVLQGVVAVRVPTLCFWLSGGCKSCNAWYESEFAAATTSVIFILCSFAIMFVFYFESGYRRELHDIEPMWKFFGVKGVVSVTYFQWIVLSTMAKVFKWEVKDVYLWHCLLYAAWMPVLAMFHATLAYPYRSQRRAPGARDAKARWLHSWLQMHEDGVAVGADVANGNVLGTFNEEVDVARVANEEELGPPVVEELAACPGISEGNEQSPPSLTLDEGRSQRGLAARLWATLTAPLFVCHGLPLWALLVWGCCYASISCLLRIVPIEMDTLPAETAYNFTCSREGDMASFFQVRSDLHFQLLNRTASEYRMPGVAGAWLPLCAGTPVGCSLGYYATRSLPSLRCNAKGLYEWDGSCESISCGTPPQLPHAAPRIGDVTRQNFTYGVVVHYDCQRPGYSGSLEAVCKVTGDWDVHGECVEITCGPPPTDIPWATPVIKNETMEVSTGMVIRYQCDAGYNGTPTATCGDDGMYVKVGRCRRECGSPPLLPHSSPKFDNAIAAAGWIEGLRALYVCDPGYVGDVTALCGADGTFAAAGACVESPKRWAYTMEAIVLSESGLLIGIFGFFVLRAIGRLRSPRSTIPLLRQDLEHANPNELAASRGGTASDVAVSQRLMEPRESTASLGGMLKESAGLPGIAQPLDSGRRS